MERYDVNEKELCRDVENGREKCTTRYAMKKCAPQKFNMKIHVLATIDKKDIGYSRKVVTTKRRSHTVIRCLNVKSEKSLTKAMEEVKKDEKSSPLVEKE